MAVPKKKVSRSRRNMRRFSSAYQLEKPTFQNCPECNEPVRPHRICAPNKGCHHARSAGRKQATPGAAVNAGQLP